MKFEIWKSSANSLWYWHLRAANHQIVAHGEGYATKDGALNAIQVVKSSFNAPVYQL